MTTYIYAFIGVITVSLVSFVGAFFLSLKDATLKKYTHLFISLAVGALLGDAFIHIIPEMFETLPNTTLASILLIFGILIFFIVEKFLHWHHHEDDTNENHTKPFGKLILFTDGIHNFIDGIIIGVSFLVSTHVGVATTIAVILHEIPQEIGDFVVLIHSGFTKKQALWLNFISALASVLGVIIVFIFGNFVENSIMWILPIAAGGFIYIAVADLIPELHKTKKVNHSILQIFAVMVGVFLMWLLLFLE